MRAKAALAASIAAAVLVVAFSGAFVRPAAAQGGAMDHLFVTVHATTVDGEVQFIPAVKLIGEVPTRMNVTVVNDDPTAQDHSFTIRSTNASAPSPFIVDTDTFPAGQTRWVEFILWGDTIEVGPRNDTFEAASGGGVRFFCRPHEDIPMEGRIAIGGLAPEPVEPEEKGVFLRAYWIGVLGMAGTLLLVGLSYFVIKSSSRHFRDHHEHIRRGGP